jgi:hypothetical protein
VLLVTDPDNVVPVRRASDGLTAFVQGGANGRIEIRLINTGVATLRKGDVFVTSGSGGLYPPGIPVAVATEPHRDGATGHLASDPSDADFVLVLPPGRPVPRPLWKPRRKPRRHRPPTTATTEARQAMPLPFSARVPKTSCGDGSIAGPRPCWRKGCRGFRRCWRRW